MEIEIEKFKDKKYFTFNKNSRIRIRHENALVLENGWIDIDLDGDGYVVGIEIHEGNPFGRTPLQAFQPKPKESQWKI